MRRLLLRGDVRQRNDKPTKSMLLEFVGRGLTFHEYLYGYPEGTFFAVQLADLAYPEDVEGAGRAAGINVDSLPDAPRLKQVVAEAILAGATVDAPALLREMTGANLDWTHSDRRELERKHRIAEARVREIAQLVKNDIKLRQANLRFPRFEVPPVPEASLPPLAAPLICGSGAPMPTSTPILVTTPVDVTELSQSPGQTELAESGCGPDEELLTPSSKTVVKARQAVQAARESELPQRMPNGVRRRLQKLPPGAYVSYGEVLDARADLCGALTDARNLGRKDREVTVIDYDGEWPVVVRRYGQGGRTVYKVEDALRRQGVEISTGEAA